MFFKGNLKNASTVYIIPPHLHDIGSWNTSSCETLPYLFYIAIGIGTDVLATQWTSMLNDSNKSINKEVSLR